MWNRMKGNPFANTLRPVPFRTRGDSDPYLRTGHITPGMWPPIPIPRAGESPGPTEACLTRRERLELGTLPTGPGEERREARGHNLYLLTGSSSVGAELFWVTWEAAPETDMNVIRGLSNIFS